MTSPAPRRPPSPAGAPLMEVPALALGRAAQLWAARGTALSAGGWATDPRASAAGAAGFTTGFTTGVAPAAAEAARAGREAVAELAAQADGLALALRSALGEATAADARVGAAMDALRGRLAAAW